MTTSNTPQTGKAVTYMRTATASASTAAQDEHCRAFARQHNLRVCGAYWDQGTSGNRLDGPALRHLLDDLARRPVSHVVVADPSRLGRNAAIRAIVRRRIEEAGAQIIDSEPDPEQYLRTELEALIARYAAKQRRFNARAGIRHRRAQARSRASMALANRKGGDHEC